MLDLVAGLALGVVIALPQLWQSIRYYPQSIRSGRSAADKQAWGNLPPHRLLLNLLTTRIQDQIDGVFYPETAVYIGVVGLGCALLVTPLTWWWGLVVVAVLLTMGRHTPLFRWTAWAHFRIPARYCVVVNVSLALLAVTGYATLPLHYQQVLLFLQAGDLVLNLPRLLPMHPYVQRWERPSDVFDTPLTRYLHLRCQWTGGRVSGLPYPLRTGQINEIYTIGYNGGSQARWMARFRGDTNPNGSGGHDWFALNDDGERLSWYGVQFAYTMRPLPAPKWQPVVGFPYLYENLEVSRTPPTWKEVSAHYASDGSPL